MTHSTITSKGQTTLPAPVRRALHLQTGDRILYEIQGDSVIIRPQLGAMVLFGSLKPAAEKSAATFEEVRAISREKWITEAAKEGQP